MNSNQSPASSRISSQISPHQSQDFQPILSTSKTTNHSQNSLKHQKILCAAPGLEHLINLDKLLVHQKVELLEVFTNWETQNKYAIMNSKGEQILAAFEDSEFCMRLLCGPKRSFIIDVVDKQNQSILSIKRKFRPCACLRCLAECFVCAHEVIVQASNGQLLGYVRQIGSCFRPEFKIHDSNYKPILKIKGPCCFSKLFKIRCESEFKVFDLNGTQIGRIKKSFSGVLREMYTDADKFSLDFPKDLAVEIKACLLAALFLIDFMYFENEPVCKKPF